MMKDELHSATKTTFQLLSPGRLFIFPSIVKPNLNKNRKQTVINIFLPTCYGPCDCFLEKIPVSPHRILFQVIAMD